MNILNRVAKNKEIVVLYDGVHHCLDGLCSAWVCYKKFGSRAAYIPADHTSDFPLFIKGKTVYCVDISYNAETMKILRKQNKQLIAIDHHGDRKDSIREANIYRFSDVHCGCVLAWKYFPPGVPVPKLLKYVEDLDYWRFRMPHSQAVTLALSLRSLSLSLSGVGLLVRLMENQRRFKAMVSESKLLFEFKELFVCQIVANAELYQWGKYRVWMVSCPEFLRSQVGHELARKGKTFGAAYYITDGTYSFSLRSSGRFNVAAFAAQYGGGGHRAAAGFVWPRRKQFPFKKIGYEK